MPVTLGGGDKTSNYIQSSAHELGSKRLNEGTRVM